jgi:hypothetical protein
MTTAPCHQLTTAAIFAAAIEEINKAEILSKILPFDLIPNIKKYTLLNVLKEFERVLFAIRTEFWYGNNELLFLPQILFDVTEMLNYTRDVFGTRILENEEFVELADLWKSPIIWDVVQVNPDRPWNYTTLSQNPNITWEIVTSWEIVEPNRDVSYGGSPVPNNIRISQNNVFGLVQYKKHKEQNHNITKPTTDALRSRREKNKKHNVRCNA